MRLLITGGSGFIGRPLVTAALAAGYEVVCICRSGAASATLAELGAEVIGGDLTSPDSINRCVREARPTHVAHLAAEIATQRNARLVEQVNVQGTRALLEACGALGQRDATLPPLERFLFMSTVVRGPAVGQTFTEDEPIPATTPYGRSKEACDQLLLEAHGNAGFPALVLRPSHVYGAGGWFASTLADRKFRIPGSGENLWDMVHVDDVVSACLLLLAQGVPGEAYHVVDDTPITMNEFWAQIAQLTGRKPYGHVPIWLAKVIAGNSAITAAVRSARSSNSKLRSLGWTPAHPNSLAALPDILQTLGHKLV